MQKPIYLTIVAEPITKAELDALDAQIKGLLAPKLMKSTVEIYHKFDNSYKLEYDIIADGVDYLRFAIETAFDIVSPWLIYYHDDDLETELIFNRDDYSKAKNDLFGAIRWAHVRY